MMVNLSEEWNRPPPRRKLQGKIRESLGHPYRLRNFEYHSSWYRRQSFRAHDVSVDDLLKRADTAMYEAKTAGVTRRVSSTNMRVLEACVKQAICATRFHNQFDLLSNTGECRKLHHRRSIAALDAPGTGTVTPTEFIPMAEETGLIVAIGRWVLETACARIKDWETNPLASELQIAVNVSALQFHQPDFVEQVREILEKTGANPNRLKLELTESVVLDNINDAIGKMYELKKAGVRFSMDDFGTGYSSLAYLTQLPLDQLKIDQSFVRNIGTKPTDAVIVQTIIGMANSLGIDVIAEGVETEAQRTFLEHVGCKAYQGYLFGNPLSLEEFGKVALNVNFLRSRRDALTVIH